MTQKKEGPDKKRQLPELLAPAGTPDAFRAAVAAGADAVYLGGKRFGARSYAGNFSEAEMEDAIAYAHARGVQVYVTVNTLIHDRELAGATEYLVDLYAAGADAVLVQDLGFASLARDIVSDLPLHASTQMTVHNAAGVRYAAGLGFSRVVLARECTLEEVIRIASEATDTGIGLEVFAHGALCFSYSGQCLLSSVIGGRSGNRGMCAQPCRKPYTLVTGRADRYGRLTGPQNVPSADGEYLLSPKDLCTYPQLDRLVHAPVAAIKIEGRMKSPEYVAIVTAAYRRALDAIADGRPVPVDEEMAKLALAFSRGFTEGYLFKKRHSEVMGREQPDNRGLFIGTVEQYRAEEGEAVIRPAGPTVPVAGDGLFIRQTGTAGHGLGFSLNRSPRAEKGRIVLPVPRRVPPGSHVFMTSSTALAAEARRIMGGSVAGLLHPVFIDCDITVDEDGSMAFGAEIDAGGGRRIPVTYRAESALAPARTRPLAGEELTRILGKTGGTPFVLRRIALQYPGNLFAPVSALNRIRREFLIHAETELVAAGRPDRASVDAARQRIGNIRTAAAPHAAPPGTGAAPQPVLAVSVTTLPGVAAAAGAGCGLVCFEPALPGGPCPCRPDGDTGDLQDTIRSALAICRDANVPLAWRLPRITRQAELLSILAILPALCAEGLSSCMAGEMGAASAIKECCPSLSVIGSEGLNIFNAAAARQAGLACGCLTLSPELSGADLRDLVLSARAAGCSASFLLVVQGSLEAMVAENCITGPSAGCGTRKNGLGPFPQAAGIRDSTGRIFPVVTDGSCRTHILNADEICLVDRVPAILQAGIRTLAIDARWRTADYTRDTVRIYRQALQAVSAGGPGLAGTLGSLKEEVRSLAAGSITAGHFTRGLKHL
jgi:putative protease